MKKILYLIALLLPQKVEAYTIDKEFQEQQIEVLKEILNYDFFILFAIIFIILLPILLWLFFGKNKKPKPVIEVRPPKGLDCAEMAYLYRGNLKKSDVGSMIVYFATLNKLTIEENRRKGFKLIKTENAGNKKYIEDVMFTHLFLVDDEVTTSELKEYFYKAYKDTDRYLDREETHEQMFLPSTIKARPIMKILSYFAIFIINLLFTVSIIKVLPNITLVYGLLFIFLFVSIIISLNPVGYRIKDTMRNVKILLNIFYCITMFILLYEECLILILALFIIVLYSDIVIYLSENMNKRNERANRFLAKILGFKEFIEISKLEDLEKIEEATPGYMYEMLSYAMVLNKEKIWLKKCKQLGLTCPTWYNGNWDKNKFDILKKIKNVIVTEKTYMKKSELDDDFKKQLMGK